MAASIELDPGRHPWDQQPHESARMYGRFMRFRELGRRRTLTVLIKVLTASGDKLGYTSLKTHACQYRWTVRAQAWDLDQDVKDIDRLAAQRREMIDNHTRIASALLRQALVALNTYQAEDISPADAVRMIKLATDLSRACLGEPTQTVALTGPAGGPVMVDDISGMDPDQRRAYLGELAAELARRAQQDD